jgi:hypothetical protein
MFALPIRVAPQPWLTSWAVNFHSPSIPYQPRHR